MTTSAGPSGTGRTEIEIHSRAEWREWLLANHATSPSIWLVFWKKDSGGPYVAYEDVVLEALCFGWIDGQARSVDAGRRSILMAPRKPRSGWAGTNKARLELLEAQGLMRPAGQAVVDAAKLDGSWTLYDDVEAGIEPPDLAAALDDDPAARAAWDARPPSFRRLWLGQLVLAKTDATRRKRISLAIAEALAHARNSP
ncbi:MAG: YdeI/OmpD-associated family protein [Umezawaea sp.]